MLADSPLGLQVASSLRYCQLQRWNEGGREGEREGATWRVVVALGGVRGARGRESLAGRDTVMENIEDNKVRRGGRMQTDALREKMGLMV